VRFVLNLIWLVLSGLWLALAYALTGLIVCFGVVTIPFGVQLFKIAGYALWPFGRQAVRSRRHSGLSTLGNLLWFVPGLFIAFGHLVAAVLSAITIIGIPLAYANLKLIPLALSPFGREIVSGAEITQAMAGRQG
jgi:uncharacterized membrane protein YccF (DUF307 family)